MQQEAKMGLRSVVKIILEMAILCSKKNPVALFYQIVYMSCHNHPILSSTY